MKICAQCYVDGILQYGKSDDRSSTNLKEVHFVDSNAEVVREISQAFNDHTFAMEAATYKTQQNPLQSGEMNLYIQAGEITTMSVDAICCGEYIYMGVNMHNMQYMHGFLSRYIHDYNRKHHRKYDLKEAMSGKRFEVGSTVVMPNKKWFDVIHVWLPATQSFTTLLGGLKDEYFKQYALCMKNMLQEADQCGYPSIACSLFGAGMYKLSILFSKRDNILMVY